ncbi:TPA: CRISPR-associated endonuclease Cas2 [Candidatus Nomurabacteria bacterium]|nr:MAG: Transcriptional regulator, PaaX family [Parcubacteria bacterium RAAC4_OD1_1]HCY26454.1 CRISPR-associated endonuclease Cas2 [Candidatus Nomurabacteria bacterium]
MSGLEKELKKEQKKINIQKIILASVATAGLLSVALVAPNAIQMLKSFGIDKKLNNFKNDTKRSLSKMISLGLVIFVEKDGHKFLKLTEKGKLKLINLEKSNFKFKKPKKWDKKWRIVIFDIPQSRKNQRDKLRFTLKQIGFIKLQHSVWIYPYDCEELITLLKLDFKIGKEIIYIIAEKIENDKALRTFFKLD